MSRKPTKRKPAKPRKPPEVTPSNTWSCTSCAGYPQFEHKAMMEHLRTVHGLTMPIKGTKKMLMHLDGPTWFSSSYEWTIGGVHAVQNIVTVREKRDPFRSYDR